MTDSDFKDSDFLDTSGLNCPLPVLRARKRLQSLPSGARLTIRSTDPAAAREFRAFCDSQGATLIALEEENGGATVVTLEKD